jgi:colicin import membrane protein
MAAAAAPQDPSRLAAAVLSVAMHLLLVLVLIAGISWQSRTPDAVTVELWQPPPEPVVQAPPPSKPVEVKPEPKPEPPPVVKKPDIVIEKEKKPPPKKEEPKKEAPARLNLDLRQQINEQLQREIETAQKDRERQKALEAFKGAPAPTARTTMDPGYAAAIRASIKSRIILPPDIVGNPEAVFDVEQLPTGEVLSAKLRRSSGNRAYDDAVERAILKASPLPRPDRPDQFQRQLELRFRPRE